MKKFACFCALTLMLAFGVAPRDMRAADVVASGVFLVASDDMRDPNFRETVVLVTQPERGGPFGVVINRPWARRLEDVLPDYEALKGSSDVLHYGGPVAREGLVFLVRSKQPLRRAIHVLQDVYIVADRREIDGLLRRADATRDVRVYSGYAGWAPGQLQREIAQGGWYVMPADPDMVFAEDTSSLWQRLIARAALHEVRF